MTHHTLSNPGKARRIALLAAAMLAGSAMAVPVLADVPSAAATQKAAAVEKLLAEADKAMQAGNFRAALISLKNAVTAAPRDGNARTKLGVALVQMNDAAGAERELRQARKDGAPELLVLPPLFAVMLLRNENQLLLDQFPEPAATGGGPAAADISRARALALQNLNKKPEALAAMDRSLALRRDSNGLLTRARLSYQQGDIPTALKFVDEAITKATNSEPLLSKVGMLMSVDRNAEALELSNQLLAKYPGDLRGQLGRVEAYINLNRNAEAKAEIDAILAKYPTSNMGLYYRALLMARAGDNKGAWGIAQNLPAELRDISPRIAIMMARMAVAAGNTETGASILNRLLLKSPELAQARLRLAAIRMEQSNPEAALAVIQPIRDSADPLAIELLGNIYIKLRRDQDALNTFKRLDSITKNRADVKRTLGILEMRMGNVDQGIKDLAQAAARNPSDISVTDPLVNGLVQQKRFAEALAVAERMAKDPARLTQSLIYRGGILLSKGDNPGAAAAFDKAVAGDPKSTAALFARSQMLQATQKPAEASRDLRAVLALDSKNSQALMKLAQIGASQGDEQTVRDALGKAIAADPANVAPRLALISYLNTRSKPRESLTAANELLRMQPGNKEGLALLGNSQLALGQNKEAVLTYRRLVSLEPTAAAPQVLLGNALSLAGDRQGATRALETATKLGPGSAEVKGAQINLQITQGNFDAALALARAFQAANPGSQADVLLADTLDQTRHRDEAIAVLNKSLSSRPNPDVFARLLRLTAQGGDDAGTENLMSGWLAKNPNDLRTRVEFGNFLLTRGANAKAVTQFQAVLKQDPNNLVALNNLGWLLQTSDPKRALSLLTHAQKLAPNSPDILDTLGWIKLQQKDLRGGLALIQKAHAAKPQDAAVTYHLAVALDANGQRDAARQMLKGLLASGRKFQELAAANKLAAEWR